MAPQQVVDANWKTETRYGDTDRETDGETETQDNGSLASGVPPKGLEDMSLLLEVQMVRCWVKGEGLTLGRRVSLMLGRRGWFNAG